MNGGIGHIEFEFPQVTGSISGLEFVSEFQEGIVSSTVPVNPGPGVRRIPFGESHGELDAEIIQGIPDPTRPTPPDTVKIGGFALVSEDLFPGPGQVILGTIAQVSSFFPPQLRVTREVPDFSTPSQTLVAARTVRERRE